MGGGDKHISYIQPSGRPGMIGPIGPPARYDLLKGYRVVTGLHLRPSGLARHSPFHFHIMLDHICEGMSLDGSDRPSTAHWSGISTPHPRQQQTVMTATPPLRYRCNEGRSQCMQLGAEASACNTCSRADTKVAFG
jgi:hypothetical protein